jgi:hypothetical protein
MRRMAYSGMLRSVALVRTDVSEELSASFIRVTRIGVLGTTLAVTRNRRTLLVKLALFLVHRFLSSWERRRYVLPKCRFLHEPHGVTFQKTRFFIVTAVKTSNLTSEKMCPRNVTSHKIFKGHVLIKTWNEERLLTPQSCNIIPASFWS